jgi:hypothetical protein
MNLGNFKNKVAWKIYLFLEQSVSDYKYGCRVASSQKATLYPKREDD